jgi:hypothetical protein
MAEEKPEKLSQKRKKQIQKMMKPSLEAGLLVKPDDRFQPWL